MEPEVAAAVDVQAETGNAAFHQGSDVGLGRLWLPGHLAGSDPLKQRFDLPQLAQCGVGAAEAETLWTEGAIVGFDGEDVIWQLSGVRVTIGLSAATPVLLVGPEY